MRQRLLNSNHIQTAVAVGGNADMNILMEVWKEFIEPGLNPTCNPCYDRVLRNWKELEPLMISQENSDLLLDATE